MPVDPLKTPVAELRTVGPRRAELLRKIDIRTVEDLLWYLPRDVLDLTKIQSVGELQEGILQTVRGSVVDRDARQLRNGKTLTSVLLKCPGGFVRLLWFNQPYMLAKFKPDDVVLASAVAKFRDQRWELSHPRIQWLEEDDQESTGGLLPKYGLTEGLKMHEMRRFTRTAVEDFGALIADPFPTRLLESLKVPDLSTAVANLHIPQTTEEYQAGLRRVILQDLLEFQLGLTLRRRAWNVAAMAAPIEVTPKIDARIRRLFPYEFTAGQMQAVADLKRDLSCRSAMHRLLQADVGAGKTAIAVYALLAAIANGLQGVLMAPTELLANQHWLTIDHLLRDSRVERRLLTGSLGAAARRETLAAIEEGKAQLVVGTQAIIQDSVKFNRLGVVVIDEQHKFGVLQRSRFSQGELSPHVLVMTATPIPRSLCLTQFGDLDLTVISELPPGRQPVHTSRVVGKTLRKKMWEFVCQKLAEGRQLYVVCARVENDQTEEEAVGAVRAFEELRQGVLRSFTVGLVHGQVDRTEREETMQAFRDGEIQVLVATTVIEVGVDVPNASLMIVLDADRFGLSQLHQLRGRVGRGRFRGYCFLCSETEAIGTQERLEVMVRSSNGFEVAERDFELRGPGDVLGTRQSGSLPLRVADLVRDKQLLEEARLVAEGLVRSGEFDTPEFAPLKQVVLDRFSQLMELPKSG